MYLFYNKRFLRNLASVDKAIFLRFQFQHYKIVNFQSLQRKREPRMIFDDLFVSMRKYVCISMLFGCLYLLAFGAKTARWPVFYFYFITDNLLILFCFSWYVRERQETLRKRYHHRSKIIRSFEILQNSKISGNYISGNAYDILAT